MGLFNAYVTLHTSIPDIFGAVSSMVRNNPYVELPRGGSALDGIDRARLIKDLSVRLGDIQEGEDIGLVALRSIARADIGRNARLEKVRLFC